MNIDDMIKKANEIGHDEIPDSKPIQMKKIILKILDGKPERCFQTKEINALLQHDKIKTPSSGTLMRLAEQGKIEQVGYGLYRAKFVPKKQSFVEQIKLIIQKIL